MWRGRRSADSLPPPLSLPTTNHSSVATLPLVGDAEHQQEIDQAVKRAWSSSCSSSSPSHAQEIFAQVAFNAARSGASLRMTVGRYACSRCPRTYAHKGDLTRHSKQECGVEPMFSCPYCLHRSHRKANLKIHVNLIHKLPA
ncbi:hypothetical protein J6590_002356 [Homalodisca vitripennis]|nr:hypothetical protein J6590_002356 [Homalodisca vitripennis]